MKGVFVTFEGIDCSGKSTQAKLLKEYLATQGKPVVFEHFPRYDTPIGELIHKILHNDVNSDIDPLAMQMLYIADQTDYASKVQMAYITNSVVISDRYDLSTVAYGMATGAGTYKQLTNYQDCIFKPDLTFIFDIPAVTAIMRKMESDDPDVDKFEEDVDLLDLIRWSYVKIMELQASYPEFKDREIVMVDATMSVEEIQKFIREEINKRWEI